VTRSTARGGGFRRLIGQAKGILMQRDKLTGLQAFATLTRASKDTNIKLVDVAFDPLVGPRGQRGRIDRSEHIRAAVFRELHCSRHLHISNLIRIE
jgi:hypothetical protein